LQGICRLNSVTESVVVCQSADVISVRYDKGVSISLVVSEAAIFDRQSAEVNLFDNYSICLCIVLSGMRKKNERKAVGKTTNERDGRTTPGTAKSSLSNSQRENVVSIPSPPRITRPKLLLDTHELFCGAIRISELI
jgi:hypothetical protein